MSERTAQTLASAARSSLARRAIGALGPRALAWLLFAFIASLLLAVVEFGVAVFLQLLLKGLGLLDEGMRETPLFGPIVPSPLLLALGLAGLALIRAAAQFIVTQTGNVSMEMITARLRRVAVWDMLLRGATPFVSAGAVNARVGDLAAKASVFCYAAVALGAAAVQAFTLSCVMLYIAPRETAAGLVGLGVVGLMVLRVNVRTRKATADVPAQLRILTHGIERVARNIALVRILRTQDIEHRRLTTAVDAYAAYLIRAGYLGSFAAALTPFAGVLLLLSIIALSRTFIHTPGPVLLPFLYLFIRFVQSLAVAVQQSSTCNATWAILRDNLDYIGGFREDEVSAAMVVGAITIGSTVEHLPSEGGSPPAITLEDVSYTYPGATVETIRSVSLHVEPGGQFGIVGPTGCGKSTLLALILGLVSPSAGRVSIGDRPPREFLSDARTRVGYVGAEAFLIAGSIRENLRYGLSTPASDDDLWTALGQAQLRDTVQALPSALNYQINEDGSGLSAGQKQRLCLARALLNRPHLLVLDEVSANLDVATELLIAESLKVLRGHCTTILVSHRMGILRHADRTMTLGGTGGDTISA